MLTSEELRIKFPEQHYIALREDAKAVTAFMTPYGTDSGAKKRMSTVNNWYTAGLERYNHETKQYEEKGTPRPKVYDNKALSGFTIERRLNRGGSWSGGQDRWKIDDPRGFQLEISGSNLLKIIETTNIIEGEIQGECIWARLGADNILVPVGTELYKNATKNTARNKLTVPLKNLQPGYVVVLQNGQEGVYQGQYYTVESIAGYDDILKRCILSDKKRYIFYDTGKQTFFHIANPKVAEVKSYEGKVFTEGEINAEADTVVYGSLKKGIQGYNKRAVGITSVKAPVSYEMVLSEKDFDNTRYLLVEWGNDTFLAVRDTTYSAYVVDKELYYIKVRRGYSYQASKGDLYARKRYPPKQVGDLYARKRYEVNFNVQTADGILKIPV